MSPYILQGRVAFSVHHLERALCNRYDFRCDSGIINPFFDITSADILLISSIFPCLKYHATRKGIRTLFIFHKMLLTQIQLFGDFALNEQHQYISISSL